MPPMIEAIAIEMQSMKSMGGVLSVNYMKITP
jgi:hypothetical protein